MIENRFEYEERYKETDLHSIQNRLRLAKFALGETVTQTDHWFLPSNIKSLDEQERWFDYERGYALRIREETRDIREDTLITSKQLLREGDHSAMTNNEAALTTQGMTDVLMPIGVEFDPVIKDLIAEKLNRKLTFIEAKKLIERFILFSILLRLAALQKNLGSPSQSHLHTP